MHTSVEVPTPQVFDVDVEKADWALFERQVGELGLLMTALGQAETHVAEIFGLGRFSVRARRFDSRPGKASHLRTGYDFNKEADILKAREFQKQEMPLLLVGSPRCAAFSQLENLARDPKKWRSLAREGLQHLIFECALHKDQIDNSPTSGKLGFVDDPRDSGKVCRREHRGRPMSVRAVVHRRTGTGSFAPGMDDKFVEGGESAGPQVLWRARTRCVSLSAHFGS